MANPTLTALEAYAGKHAPQIMGQLYKELRLQADGIQVLQNIKSGYIMPRLRIGKGLKPYTGEFASADDQFKYTDRKMTVDRAQRDLLLDPEKYRTSYLEQYVSGSSGTNANKQGQIPFAAFAFGEFAKENAQELVELLYHGLGTAAFATWLTGSTYAAGDLVNFSLTINGKSETNYFKCLATTSTGQSPTTHPAKWLNVNNLAITKGFGKILADAVANEGFNQIATTGAITAADAYDQFTEVYRLQDEKVKGQNLVIYSAVNNYEYLLDAIEEKTKNFQLVNNIMYLPKTDNKVMVKPVSWLSGSNRLICTPMNNLVLGTDQLSDMNTLTTIPQHYKLEVSLSCLLGTQISDLDVLTVNEPD